MADAIVVSVSCIAHNHRPFIEQALESVCTQRTDFPYEVIVHDDASTDGTADVIERYAGKYPGIVRPILQTENQWSQGINPVAAFVWPRIRGTFVALCDGDDFWTDPLKLQRQVEYLHRHPSYYGCFHPVRVVHEDGTQPDAVWPTSDAAPTVFNGQPLSLDDLMVTNIIHAPSVMYRWRFHEERYPGDLTPLLMPFDWFLNLQHAAKGPIGMLPETMAVYRKHPGGAWWDAGNDVTRLYLRFGVEYVRFFSECSRTLGRTIAEPRLGQTLAAIVKAYLLAGDVEALKRIEAVWPGCLRHAAHVLFEPPTPEPDGTG